MTSLAPTEWLPEGSLACALVSGDERLADLAPRGVTGDEDEIVAAAEEAASRHLDRAALADALVAGLDELSAPARAIAAARRLGDSGVVAVVTGQQPGLFGGPALALTKALAAAGLAARLDALGIPAVPVYWHASEDHDHAEADHVSILTGESTERVRLPLPEDGRTLAATPLPAGTADVLARMAALLPDGPGRAEVDALLATRDGDTFGRWTGRLLAGLLGPLGIVVVEPHSLRVAAQEVTRYEVLRPHALAATVAAAVERVRASGHAAPLDLQRPELFYLLDDGVRRVVRIDPAAGTYDVTGGVGGSLPELLARVDADPRAFSWNVALRVLAQDRALPVAAQVCGPAELGYVTLLGAAHAALGLPRPAAVLRAGLTVLPRAAERAARALAVEPLDVVRRGAAALPETLSENTAEALDALSRLVAALPQGSGAGVRRRRDELARKADLYAQALRREEEERDGHRSRRRRTLLAACRPGGRPAERVLSPLPWIIEAGLPALADVRDLLARSYAGHVVTTLG